MWWYSTFFFSFTVLRSLIYAEMLVTSMQNRKQTSPNTPKNFLELTDPLLLALSSVLKCGDCWSVLYVYSLGFSQEIT